jgi:hypothetical protein
VNSDSDSIPPAINLSGKAQKFSRTLRVLASGATRSEAREVDSAWALLDRLAEHSGKHVVLDSSKAALRLARLARNPKGRRLRVVHLVRDARGYVTSKSFSSKWAAVMDWIAQNVLMLMVGVVSFRGRYVVITYEQMTRHPEQTLARLADLLEMKYESSMFPPFDRTDFHLIGGNSSRLAFTELRYDDKWRHKLTSREKVLIQLASGWLYWLLARLAARHERAAAA